jgi:hypothetical protein
MLWRRLDPIVETGLADSPRPQTNPRNTRLALTSYQAIY